MLSLKQSPSFGYEYLEIDISQKSKEFSIGALGCSTENENEATVAPQHDFSLSFPDISMRHFSLDNVKT